MTWEPLFSVQVEEIDKQHQKLIEIINKAHKTSFDKDKEKGNEIFNELIGFVRVHFSTEEKYFKKFDYEGTEEHTAEHMELTEKVLKLKTEFDNGKCNCEEFLSFLKEWLENHFKVQDQKYVKCFKEHGLK